MITRSGFHHSMFGLFVDAFPLLTLRLILETKISPLGIISMAGAISHQTLKKRTSQGARVDRKVAKMSHFNLTSCSRGSTEMLSKQPDNK